MLLELRIRIPIEMRTKGAVDSITRLLKSEQPYQPIWLSVYRRVTMSPPPPPPPPHVRIGVKECFLFNIIIYNNYGDTKLPPSYEHDSKTGLRIC